MSEFSDAFSGSFGVAATIFGETCRIGGVTHKCVIHDLTLTADIQSGRPGQSQSAGGGIIMTRTAWTAARGRKGTQVTVSGEVFRVLNNPSVGYTSDTVTLQLGPLT